MKDCFTDPSVKNDFNKAGLCSFTDFWQLDLPLLDDINKSKAGWSSVTKIEITTETNSHSTNYYLKRQQNYFFKTLLHPLRGVLSLEKEYHAANLLKQHHIACITPIYFAKRKIGKDWQAILITKDISPLKEIDDYLINKIFSEQVLIDMAHFIANLHDKHLRHGALYSKHIYYHPDKGFALIDLENIRHFLLRKPALKREFSRLLKNPEVFSNEVANIFCKAYFDGEIPDYIQKIIDNRTVK